MGWLNFMKTSIQLSLKMCVRMWRNLHNSVGIFGAARLFFFAWNFRNISRYKIVDFVFQAFSSKRLNINSHKLSNEQPFERRTPIRLQIRVLLAWILINAFATVRISLISFPSINVIAKSAVDTANVAFEHCWSLNARQLSISNECEI